MPVTPVFSGKFFREGELWNVGLGAEHAVVAHRKGLADVARLLGRPGVEVHCLDLVDAAVVEGDLGQTIDAAGRSVIEQRIRDLQEDVEDARGDNDLGCLERVERELDELVDDLTRQLGLGGRSRRMGGTVERARNTVSWRVRSTLKSIGEVAPSLARHLTHSIRLGTFAVYAPEHPVAWELAGRGDDGGYAGRAAASPAPSAAPTAPVLPGVLRRFGFIGRPAEITQLSKAWIDRVRVVLVSGEAGAGKTRLIGEFVTALEPRPQILWGCCTADRLGAYEPFVEPVRQLMRRSDASEYAGAELARLVPELAGEQQWLIGPSRAEPDVEQRLLFEAVVQLLASAGPAVLVLEDLHWADAASLALLAFLAGSPSLDEVTVLGSVRSTDQSPSNAATLTDLRRVARLERLTLGGLTPSEVGTLVRLIAGRSVPPALVATVIDATEGNPLFIEELTEHLLAVDPTSPATTMTVPASLRDTIGRRLETLSPDGLALVRSGAVLGRVFDLDLAGRLADLDGNRLLSACDDVLLSGLMTEASAVALSFSHALVQSDVYETTSAPRRLTLHRRAAELLEHAVDGGRDNRDSVVFDVARHWALVAAVDVRAASSAARWALRAGDAAAAAADIDEAIVRYEQASVLWGDDRGARAVALVRLGRALSSLGRADDADEQFRAARLLAEAVGDAELFAEAAIGLAATVRYGHHDLERIDALERAIELLGPDEHVLRPTAAAMLKRQLGFESSEDSYRRRQIAARVVLDVLSGDDLQPALLLSLGAARDSIVVDDPVVLDRVSRQIVAAASSPRNLAVLANGWYGRAWAALELGDGVGWRESVAAFSGLADELRLPYELALAATMESTSALIAGRYARSEELSLRALALATESGDPNASAVHLTGTVMRGLDLGHAVAMLPLVESMRTQLAEVPTFMAGWAMTAAAAGAHDVARSLLHEQAAVGFDRVRRDLEWLPVIGFFCHACAGVGDVEVAPTLYDLLIANPARTVRVGPLAGWWGPTDHHLGALCRVMGRLDESQRRLRDALDVCDRLGARPWEARVRFELATVVELLGDHDGEADRLRAAGHRIADDLHAPGLRSLVP